MFCIKDVSEVLAFVKGEMKPISAFNDNEGALL